MPDPIKLNNTYYKNLREFTAWRPWGEDTGHTKKNDEYIAIGETALIKRMNLSPALQRLIDHGWKAATVPTTTRRMPGLMGRHRPVSNLPEKPSPLRAGFGRPIANNFGHIHELEVVGAYAFRGDRRPPEAIHADKGFHPPASRTDSYYMNTIAEKFYDYMQRKHGLKLDAAAKDAWVKKMVSYIQKPENVDDRKLFGDYLFWRKVLEIEETHLQRMSNDSFLKGYISATRDISVAREGAMGLLGGSGTSNTTNLGGWIYALRVNPGILLKKGVANISKEEGEIAHLGSIMWQDVVGFVELNPLSPYQPIYIRNMFDQHEFRKFKQVIASLSQVIPRS